METGRDVGSCPVQPVHRWFLDVVAVAAAAAAAVVGVGVTILRRQRERRRRMKTTAGHSFHADDLNVGRRSAMYLFVTLVRFRFVRF